MTVESVRLTSHFILIYSNSEPAQKAFHLVDIQDRSRLDAWSSFLTALVYTLQRRSRLVRSQLILQDLQVSSK
jgi:hypothetical protein